MAKNQSRRVAIAHLLQLGHYVDVTKDGDLVDLYGQDILPIFDGDEMVDYYVRDKNGKQFFMRDNGLYTDASNIIYDDYLNNHKYKSIDEMKPYQYFVIPFTYLRGLELGWMSNDPDIQEVSKLLKEGNLEGIYNLGKNYYDINIKPKLFGKHIINPTPKKVAVNDYSNYIESYYRFVNNLRMNNNHIEGDMYDKGIERISKGFNPKLDNLRIKTITQEPVIEEQVTKIPKDYIGDINKEIDSSVARGRRYYVSESLNLDNHSFGFHNRETPARNIKTRGIMAFAYHAFKPFGQEDKPNHIEKYYIGISPEGKIKVGDKSSFSDGDVMSLTTGWDISNFVFDQYGNSIFASNSKSTELLPLMELANGRGRVGINLLQPHGGTGDTYSYIYGGRVIIKIDDEIRFVSGSPKYISKLFEEMKKRHNTNHGMIFNLDGKANNIGLYTDDGIIKANDLDSLRRINTSGGHAIYFLNE